MPITSSAIKKERQDRRKTAVNNRIRRQLKEILKKARQKPTKKALSQAYQTLDRAAKKRIIHPNKASRLKSRLIQAAKKKPA